VVVCQVDQVVIHVARQAHLLRSDELCQVRGVVAGDPARGVDAGAFEYSVDAVFGFQAVFHHFELELADGAHQQTAIDQRGEDLDRAFFAEFAQAFL
jgi:hypothetical protein